MRDESHLPIKNNLLAALPPDEYQRLSPHLEYVKLDRGQVIYKVDEPSSHLYFPTSAMISMVSSMSDGATVEVGVIGREGISGLHLLLGSDDSNNDCMAQLPGEALKINAETLRAEFKRGGKLQGVILRYIHGLMIQISQSAACNRLHSVEERLARWLLMTHDRATGDELSLTHEFLAMMLGTRRAGVTGAAIALQGEGFIRYSRGHITMLDRTGLEDFSCECYRTFKAEFDKLHIGQPG